MTLFLECFVNVKFIVFQERNNSILEADEASQLEAAIQASLAEASSEQANNLQSGIHSDDGKEDSDTLEAFDSDSDVDYSLDKSDKSNVQKGLTGDTSTGICNSKELVTNEVRDDGSTSVCSEEASTVAETSSLPDTEEWKAYLGSPSDPESKLMLRLPDGSRDIVSMPSSSKLKVSFYCW